MTMESNMKINRIYAIGTSGKAKGITFEALQDSNGKYVLNKKVPSSASTKTNYAINKVLVDALDDAWNLMTDNEYLINLTSPRNTRALRKKSALKVEFAS